MPAPTVETSKQSWHSQSAEEVTRMLGSHAERGISADDVARLLSQHGPNALPETQRRSIWPVILRQFASPLIYILFVAAGIAFFLGKHDDALVILVVVLINAGIGVFQEHRAEQSMDALRRLTAVRARVVRGGNEEMIEARDLVPGDVMLVGAGDAIAADARLIE